MKLSMYDRHWTYLWYVVKTVNVFDALFSSVFRMVSSDYNFVNDFVKEYAAISIAIKRYVRACVCDV